MSFRPLLAALSIALTATFAALAAVPATSHAQESPDESPRPQPLEDPRELQDLPGVDDKLGEYLRFPQPRPPGQIRQLAVNDREVCALTRGGLMYCWLYETPDQVRTGEELFVGVAAGDNHLCAIDSTARPTCWGPNLTDTEFPDVPLSDMAAGRNHTCGVDTTGRPVCWGRQLDADHRNPPDGPFQHVAAGGDATCGASSWASTRCWGPDAVSEEPFDHPMRELSVSSNGVCGIDGANRPTCEFTDRATGSEPPADVARDIAAGRDFVCTLETTGILECDGAGAPALPESPPLAEQIEAGEQTLCAVTPWQSIQCWNRDGEVLGGDA